MKQYFSRALLAVTLIQCGCTNLQTAATSDAIPTQAPRQSTILVNLHRGGSARIPTSRQGLTLRRVLSDARDISSRGGRIVLAHAVNNLPLPTGEIASSREKELRLHLDTECIILATGGTIIIAPELLISRTALGSLRVFPGNVIQSVPFKVIDKLRSPNDGNVTVSSEHFPPRIAQINNRTALATICEFPLWETGPLQIGESPRLDPALLRPNVAVITRRHLGRNYVLILPCSIRDVGEPTPSSDLLSRDTNVSTLFGTLLLTAGDSVHLTRLENIPLVRLGLALPPPATTFAPSNSPPVSTGIHTGRIHNEARSALALVPGLSEIETAKKRIGARVARLIP